MLYTYTCGNIINNNDEWTHFFWKIYLSHFILERVAKGLRKGWCWLCVRGELETEIDCHILIPSSSDHSSTSSSFCWAAQSWVLRAQALCLELVLTPRASYLQQQLELNWLELPPTSNSLKSSVAPGYIIVWYPPASCGRMHLHRIQPRPQVEVIFRYLRLDASVSWLMTRLRVNMLQKKWTMNVMLVFFKIASSYCLNWLGLS